MKRKVTLAACLVVLVALAFTPQRSRARQFVIPLDASLAAVARATGGAAEPHGDGILLRFRDEGTAIVTRNAGLLNVDCVGAGIDCTFASGTVTVTVGGAGSVNFSDLLDVTGGLPHDYSGQANYDVLCFDTSVVVPCTPSSQSGYQNHSADGGVLEDTDDVNDIFINTLGVSLTITKVTCKPDQAASPTIMLQKDDGAAANMFSASMTCNTTPSGTDGTDGILTSFVAGENVLAAGDSIKLLTTTAGGVATYYTVYITYKRTP